MNSLSSESLVNDWSKVHAGLSKAFEAFLQSEGTGTQIRGRETPSD